MYPKQGVLFNCLRNTSTRRPVASYIRRVKTKISCFLFCLLFLNGPLLAQTEPVRDYGQAYSGLFTEGSVRGALVNGTDADGWALDVGIRQALIMSLLDTRLAYRFSTFDVDGDALVQHAAEITSAFHPLYMAYLWSDWFGYVLGGWYLEGGLGVHTATLNNESDLGIMYSLGTGLDIPITDPDVGWSIWIDLGYRFRFEDFDAPTGEIELDGHHGFVGLGLRFNRLLF